MSNAPRVRDLFDIPERVHQGDFVLKLTEGLSHPEETAAQYVATPALVDAFDRALGLIGDALSSGQSKATYLHGSFGSGKSHFMAMLSLLLAGHEAAWRIPELHGLREKYAYAGKQRLLELHFHMIGAETLESKLFSTYLQHVREHHAEAELPGLFADEELFENARTTLSRVGAERFFAEMGDAKTGWGKHGAGWTQERFDEHAASTDPRERAKLFSALVKSWFPAYTSQGQLPGFGRGPCGSGPARERARLCGRGALPRRADSLALAPGERALVAQPRNREDDQAGGSPAERSRHPHRELRRAPAQPRRDGRQDVHGR